MQAPAAQGVRAEWMCGKASLGYFLQTNMIIGIAQLPHIDHGSTSARAQLHPRACPRAQNELPPKEIASLVCALAASLHTALSLKEAYCRHDILRNRAVDRYNMTDQAAYFCMLARWITF